jgi:DNA-directed RNA polymerase subunit RPC12/RpoP
MNSENLYYECLICEHKWAAKTVKKTGVPQCPECQSLYHVRRHGDPQDCERF